MYDEFSFESNPRFIFHDSPGFEAGGDQEIDDVLSFLQEKTKANEVKDQIHAIWCIFFYPLMISHSRHVFRFCFTPDVSRPLLGLEQMFFNEQLGWNGRFI